MRYSHNEDTSLLASMTPGKNVTIQILHLATGNLINLVTDVCNESTQMPGLYTWRTSNIDEPSLLTDYHDLYYRMTDEDGKFFEGKFTFGGYPDRDIATHLRDDGFDPDEIIRILNAINMNI